MAATFATLGARHPDAGGVPTYVRRAFGARPATITGWWFYFAVPCGVPAAAIFGGSYVAAALGGGRTTMLATAAGLVAIVALPGRPTRGNGPGKVPRRSLAVIAGLSFAGLGFLAVTGDDVQPLLLATTSCVVAVYAVATAAAVRLLGRGSVGRRTAVAALLLVLALLAVTGWYLLWPAVLAVAATCYLRRTGRTGRIRRHRWDGVAAGDPRPTATILSTVRSPHH